MAAYNAAMEKEQGFGPRETLFICLSRPGCFRCYGCDKVVPFEGGKFHWKSAAHKDEEGNWLWTKKEGQEQLTKPSKDELKEWASRKDPGKYKQAGPSSSNAFP
jgi:hypothetical protein